MVGSDKYSAEMYSGTSVEGLSKLEERNGSQNVLKELGCGSSSSSSSGIKNQYSSVLQVGWKATAIA